MKNTISTRNVHFLINRGNVDYTWLRVCFATEFATTCIPSHFLYFIYTHHTVFLCWKVFQAALIFILQQVEEVNAVLSIFHTDYMEKKKPQPTLSASCTGSIIRNHCQRQGTPCENLTQAGTRSLWALLPKNRDEGLTEVFFCSCC